MTRSAYGHAVEYPSDMRDLATAHFQENGTLHLFACMAMYHPTSTHPPPLHTSQSFVLTMSEAPELGRGLRGVMVPGFLWP